MNADVLKKHIAHLNRHAFSQFITHLFNENAVSESFSDFSPFPEAGEDVYYQPYLDSYGESIHRVFLIHCPPIELFQPTNKFVLEDPLIIKRLTAVRSHYHGRRGQWGMVSPSLIEDDALKTIGFLINCYGINKSIYDSMIIPAYQRLKRKYGLKKPTVLVGSADSFVDKAPERAERSLNKVLNTHDGVAIIISNNDLAVRDYTCERSLQGVVRSTKYPYQPILVSEAIKQRSILHEFESLLVHDANEKQLESFLAEHYKDIFGSKYDRIETQLWLRFPDLDLTSHDRRLDVFLRNSVINDWELFEIKRPIKISCSHSDIPVLTAQVTRAIQQIKNYSRTLGQDKVKRRFAKQGIAYYEPQLSVIIGRTPDIPHDQWRWLRAANSDKVNIITYDDMVSEMRIRMKERIELLSILQS